MCGIYLTNIQTSRADQLHKLDSIKFRGPDFTGIEQVDGITFGHLRLSIVDLEERSNQPMCFENLTIVFNGEVYNYLDIKNELVQLGHSFQTTSDTEVLIQGYKQWGRDVVVKLNGMFAFAIYDNLSKKIFCSRDRLGVKPFYYYWKDGLFEICSQLRPICRNKTLNPEAISIYLECAYIPSPLTIYNEIRKLPAGCNLEIDLKENQINTYKYWELKEINQSQISYEEAKQKIHELLIDAVKIRMNSDVPFGSLLSGGIDSSLVSSIAAKISNKPINTFAIGFNDPEHDESTISAQYAKILGSEHVQTVCTPADCFELIPKLVEVYDEPFGDSSALPSLLLYKVIKSHITMALSGDGGDESFLGYHYFDWAAKFEKLFAIPFFLRRFLSNFIILDVFGSSTNTIRTIFRLKTINQFVAGIFVGFNSLVKNRNFGWLKNYERYFKLSNNIIQNTADLGIGLWLENDSNVKVDRASMAFSVEVRSPFLDYRIIELARTLPVEYRFQSGIKKRILKDILAEYIPRNVFDHPKKGFTLPIAAWIREDLKQEIIGNLPDDFLRIVPNLNVKKLKKMIELHLKSKRDFSTYIWRLYVLSKWYQEFGFYEKIEVSSMYKNSNDLTVVAVDSSSINSASCSHLRS